MRVTYLDVDSIGAPYEGGQARRTFEVARRVARIHEVRVITAGHPQLRTQIIDGVRYERMFPLPKPANFISYFAEAIPRGLASNADLIVESFSVPFTASLLARLSPVPVLGVANYLFARNLAKKYHLPFDRIEKLAVQPFRHVIALTEQQRQHIKELAPRANIRVIPNGADDRARLFRWTGTGGYVAFMGRLDIHQKGLDILLECARQLPPHCTLRIAGEGPDKCTLHNMVAQLGLQTRVELLGALGGDNRHEFLAKAAALAFPSRYEGQSLVLLDAMTIGVPIVAFDIPMNAETLRHTGILTRPFNVGEFADALQNVLENPRIAADVAVSEQQASMRYSWDSVANQELSFYDEILRARRSNKPSRR